MGSGDSMAVEEGVAMVGVGPTLDLLSGFPASQKQKLLLASQFVFFFFSFLPDRPLLFVFLGCRHLVTRGSSSASSAATFALIFGPFLLHAAAEQEEEGGGGTSWMAAFPFGEVHSLPPSLALPLPPDMTSAAFKVPT